MQRDVNGYPGGLCLVRVGVDRKENLRIAQNSRPRDNRADLVSKHCRQTEVLPVARNRAQKLSPAPQSRLFSTNLQNLRKLLIDSAVFIEEVKAFALKRTK